MGIFLRQSYNVKPLRWGSPADIEYAVKVNAEKVYDVDSDSIVLAMPLFWGLPCLDYSGKRNDGVNHGTYYKDGKLEFDGNSNYIDCGNNDSLDITEEITFVGQVKFDSSKNHYLVENYHKIGVIRYTGNNISFFVVIGGISNRISTVSSTNNNEWLHIITTRDTISGLRIYINSINQAVTLNSGNQNPLGSIEAGNPFYIGRFGAGGNYWFNGAIKFFCVFNVSFSADQIALFHVLPYGLYQPVIRRSYFFVTNIPVFMHHYNQMRAA